MATFKTWGVGQVYILGSGENVYDPEFRLSITVGDQVPLVPLGAIVAKIGAVDPEQIEGIAAKSAVVAFRMFTFSV